MKPENFLIGSGKNLNKIYLIDFGLAKRYRSAQTQHHIPFKEHKSLTGTARYASVNAHMGFEHSRRDDLEALGYVLLYFLRGNLPWQNIRKKEKAAKYKKIMECKMRNTPEFITKGYPSTFFLTNNVDVFADYLEYVKGLEFEAKPNYKLIQALFKDIFFQKKYKEDNEFDWHTLKVTN